jgi:hypothetical protein
MRRPGGNAADTGALHRQNAHLSSDQILLFLDGELSPRENAQAQAHFEACWTCRVRSLQVEEVIADVVAYRDCLIKSSIPLASDVRATFLMRLRQLARSTGKSTMANHIQNLSRTLRFFLEGEFIPRRAWISAIVIASLTLSLLVRFWEVPKVSASQFLSNAQAAETRALDGIPKPVVYQKLQIRLGNQTLARTIYRNLAADTQVDYFNSGAEETSSKPTSILRTAGLRSSHEFDPDFERTFRDAQLSWKDPLSPSSYDAWRNGLSKKEEEVTQVGDGRLTLKTTTAEGPIKEATITVRASDFHPIAEVFYLGDSRLIEVTELAWQVIPMEAIDSDIFAGMHVSLPGAVHPTVAVSSEPTDAELAETELRARIALHAEGADLGEQIEFDHSNSSAAFRSLIIRGIVNTTERKSELSAALQVIPHVELQLQTAQEAAQQYELSAANVTKAADELRSKSLNLPTQQAYQGSDFPGNEAQSAIPGIGAVRRTPLEEQLEKRFPNPAERFRFVNSALEGAQDCLAQAWALRRLQERYTPQEVALLNPGSRQTLELLIRDHVSALHENVSALQDLVLPVLPESLAATEFNSPVDVEAISAGSVDDWRSSVDEIFPKVQGLEIQVVTLFGGPGEIMPDRQGGVNELRTTLSQLERQLPVLNQRVNVRFLGEQK